jgi:hypothetical protein
MTQRAKHILSVMVVYQPITKHINHSLAHYIYIILKIKIKKTLPKELFHLDP